MEVRFTGGTLEVGLPGSLDLTNRVSLIEAIRTNLSPTVRLVRLDASALRVIDTAGLGALACVLRLAMDTTHTYPVLASARFEIRECLRAVLLLRHFDLSC